MQVGQWKNVDLAAVAQEGWSSASDRKTPFIAVGNFHTMVLQWHNYSTVISVM